VWRDDMSVEDLLTFFLDHALHHAPVVDAESSLVGFVSLSDLVCERADHGDTEEIALRVHWLPARLRAGSGFHAQSEARTVADIMSQPAICLQASATVTMARA